MLNVIFYACMGLIFIASVPIWRSCLQRFLSTEPMVEPRPQRGSPIGLVDLVAMLFVWLFSQILAGVVFARTFGIEMSELESLGGSKMTMLMLVAGMGQLVAVAIGMAFLVARYSDWEVIGWRPNYIRADLKLALGGFLLVAPIVLVVQMLLSLIVEYKHPAMEAMIKDANAFTVIAVWLSAVISAPIAEEVVFRGWIQNWLQRCSFEPGELSASIVGGWPGKSAPEWNEAIDQIEQALETEVTETEDAERVPQTDVNPYTATRHAPLTGTPIERSQLDGNRELPSDVQSHDPVRVWIAIFITSLLFALAHYGHGLAPIPLFGLSVLLGYLYHRTGSLLPCIGLHMLNNGYSVFWLTVQILLGDPADLP